MRHTALKSALLHLSATFLLIMGTVSASAQYYMNVLKNDGTNVQYKVSDINQVWFSGTASPSVLYEFVDLGLSVKWATFNVGASKPEGYGDYYAWGEIVPYYEVGYSQEHPQKHWKDGKSGGYIWSTYKYCNGSDDKLTKYCSNSNYGNNGFTDTKTTLDPEDDVAHVKWGGSWRMPTRTEFDELIDNCTWTWTTLNGVNGYRVTSNKSGYTDHSIFLPAAGCRYDTDLGGVGSSGYYRSSSLYEDYPCPAWSLGFYSDDHGTHSIFRYYGFSVRPVCP